jgi:glucoamylase
VTRAPGGPGIPPTWSTSDKDAIGTSHRSSRVWFTIGRGILNEVYWPHVDRPQVRDLGFIVADGAGFWSEVKRDATHDVRHEPDGIPAISVVHEHPRYRLGLRICADDHADVVRIEVRLDDLRDPADPARRANPLRLYPLLAPHLGFGGTEDEAWAGSYNGRPMLFARHDEWALALASDPPPLRQSVGFVGVSDGWQDFAANGGMTWTYGIADRGNVAGMTELALDGGAGQLALAFGNRPEEAGHEALAALAERFEGAWDEYIESWRGFVRTVVPPPTDLPPEARELYLTSATVLRSSQDRTEPGATVASLSIPWGNTRNDIGGYHLVWSRDLVETAGAFVALGSVEVARRTVAHLIASQDPDGHWTQNQWVDGVPYWTGVQLDEAAYPILLAGALHDGAEHMHGMSGTPAAQFRELLTDDALETMIRRAAGFIARTGPATSQDRWEENAGLAPSTLAPVVAALVVAAGHLPKAAARYCLELADDWNASIEAWTYATGTRLAREHGVDGYYVRIASPEVLAGAPLSTPVPVRNRPGDALVPADEMIGTDFLALVRFGLRLPDDPRICSSLELADALLRTETPSGPVWHRYNGDGYGEHEDGGAYDGTGIGRGWPLLVGERGHYELAVGRDARPYLETMRRMASSGGMLPEQVWDAAPIPERGLAPGRPSGSAMPLAWAHAEYVKLVRSIVLGSPIDRPAAAWRRYGGRAPVPSRATWRFSAPRRAMPAGRVLRLEVLAPSRVHCSLDGGSSWIDVDAMDTGLGVWIADIPGSRELRPGATVDFTFWWPEASKWEPTTWRVDVVDPGDEGRREGTG